MTITQTFHRGFTLPMLLIVSTVLMIMGSAILQGTVSVKNSLDAQFYNQLAREAAEAGVRYGQACIKNNATWSQLRPDTTCTGTLNSGAPNTVLTTERYRTTFVVDPIDERADGSTIVTARGVTELIRTNDAGSPVYREYRETLSEATTATSTGVIPDTITTNQTVGADAATYMLGYDKTMYGMGDNGNGQLGDGSSTSRSLPTGFKLPDGVFAKKVVTGSVNTFVLGSNGRVYGAGDNANGQLANGTTNNTSVINPVEFGMPTSIFAVDVVTGGAGAGRNTFVLGSNGRVYGAGTNQYNQLHHTAAPTGFCDNQNVCHTRIVLPAPDGQRVKKMATTYGANNNAMLIVLTEDGSVYGRGRNNYTQLGGTSTSDTDNKTSFTRINLPSGVLGVDIQTSYYNTYILGSDGQVYSFGRGSAGQFGNGGTSTRYNTAQRFGLPGSLRALKMSIGTSSNTSETDGNSQNSAWVLASDHQVYGAGQNHKGQLGDGTTTDRSTPVRFSLPSGLTAQDVSSLYFTACVLTNTKQVYCAGDNKYGQLGIGNTVDQSTPQLFPLPSGVLAQSVVVGYGTVHILGSDGNIYAAGRNNAGQLGDGTTTQQNSPVVVQRPHVELEREANSISMANVWTNVLSSDGTVWSTGQNNEGQLGGGTTTSDQHTPLQFLLPQGYAKSVQGGAYATRVLSSDGQLYGAGANADGHLGTMNSDPQPTPVRFELPSGLTVRDYVISTSSSESVTFVIASDNLVYGAGRNGQGQLGNTTTDRVSVPASANKFRLPSGVTASKVFFGDGGVVNSTYVLGTNGVLYAAGLNSNGQLGIGSTNSPTVCTNTCPTVQMPSGVTAKEVSIGAGGRASYFLGSNGRPYAAGYNNWGQLGDGTTTQRTVPTEMSLPSGLKALKIVPTTGAAAHSVYVLASDGQVYGAGRNSHGQLGRGTEDNFAHTNLEPVQMPSGLTAVDFWIGQESVFILASNGQIYGAGRNDAGQLGTGDKTNKTTATTAFQLPSGVTAVTMATQYAISSGVSQRYFTGVLGSDGQLYVVGNNADGQIGGMTGESLIPRPYELPQPSRQPGIIF